MTVSNFLGLIGGFQIQIIIKNLIRRVFFVKANQC